MTLFIKNLVFTVMVPGSVALWIPLRFLVSWDAAWDPVRVVFGCIPVAMGGGMYVWCVWDFGRRGRGTPLPLDPPRTLRASGLYQLVRNPMYLGVLQMVLGMAILFRSLPVLIYTGVVFLLFHLVTRFYEEPTLTKKFGSSYVEYCRRTPRWIPALPDRKE